MHSILPRDPVHFGLYNPKSYICKMKNTEMTSKNKLTVQYKNCGVTLHHQYVTRVNGLTHSWKKRYMAMFRAVFTAPHQANTEKCDVQGVYMCTATEANAKGIGQKGDILE